MTTPLTVLPTRTDASLGPPKTDPGWAVDIARQLRLVPEWETAADWIVELAAEMGIISSPAVGSVQEILDRLGRGDPRYQRHLDHFLYRNAAALDNIWNLVSGTWALIDAAGGIIRAPQNSGVECFLRTHGYDLYRAALPRVLCSVMYDAIDALSPVWRCGAISATAQEGFGIEYLKSASDFFRAWSMTGGVRSYAVTDVAPVVGTRYSISIRLTNIPVATKTMLAIDGVDKAIETTSIGQAAMGRYTSLGAAAVAGKFVYMDWIGMEQDTGQANT